MNIPRTDTSQGAFFIWAITVKAGMLLSCAFPPYVLIVLIVLQAFVESAVLTDI